MVCRVWRPRASIKRMHVLNPEKLCCIAIHQPEMHGSLHGAMKILAGMRSRLHSNWTTEPSLLNTRERERLLAYLVGVALIACEDRD